ncbi:uncharacterized protein LOC111308830 isoform X5 [Durio zibethinus]|uniref:Uncharacterized protein LOC111308830 isoform X5 n=1 Tax=Durio zibethinus TaxID=66656 RepID=A0A6P6AEH5_DURZI|nr:uncharacterized protein LOC111308830 isoform X5 [Durio zibethinus]
MASIFTLPRPTPSPYFPKYHQVFHCSVMQSPLLKGWKHGFSRKETFKTFTSITSIERRRRRRTLICAVNQDAEKAFKKTVEVDRLIDMLREANPEEQMFQMEQEGKLDEGFLSEVSAQLRQSKEDGDKPGLEAMLQKVLQLYASIVLLKRSYAKKGNEVLKAEQFLETVIKAPEQQWNKLLIDGLTVGKGEISPEEFYAVIKKRIERTLIRTVRGTLCLEFLLAVDSTLFSFQPLLFILPISVSCFLSRSQEGGSYQQRILTEYLKGIESRAEEIVQFLQGNAE